MKRYLKWIICILSFIVFLLLSILVLKKEDIYLDTSFYNFISKYISNNLTIVARYLTYIGSGIVVISITILFLIFLKNKRYGIYMALDLILITLFQLVLKNIFARGRPIDINLIDETGYSFPSGHSLTAMAFYGFIIYLIYKSNINKKSKSLFITLLVMIILVIGLSRIYLGVHYFTDVVGGFTFSLSYLIIYTSILEKIRKKET